LTAVRTIAILPIKSFGAAKQRLSSLLTGESREALAQAMFSDVLATLCEVPAIDEIVVVTANRLAGDAARRDQVAVIHDVEESGQNAAAGLGINHALAAGHDRVLLVPGDTPLLGGDELTGMLDRAEAGATAATIVPDRHGEGTNALLLSPPTAIEPSFGPDSLARHLMAARAAGISHRVEAPAGLMLDIDTPEDLAALCATLGKPGARAPRTRVALARLGEAQAEPRPVQVHS
jgi:2-phospho-L-lactate guanylyltransferase